MPRFKKLASYLRLAADAVSAPGFIDGGIASGLHAVETLDHTSHSGVNNSVEFEENQKDLLERKRKKRKKTYGF